MGHRNITCITFPRSGHHLLVNTLLKYFSRDVNYSKIGDKGFLGRTPIRAGTFCYCEYYRHCLQHPCIDKRTNFQKNHDFKLRIKNDFTQYYIVQCRTPVEAIVSSYYFRKAAPQRTPLKTQSIIPILKRCKHALIHLIFYRDNAFSKLVFWYELLYWKRFIYKWAINNKNKNIYFLPYCELIKAPKTKLKEVIKFINPDELIDEALLSDIINHLHIYNRSLVKKQNFFLQIFLRRWNKKSCRNLKF